MPDEYASVVADGLEVSSNSESKEEMQEILGVTPEDDIQVDKLSSTSTPPVSEAKPPEPVEPTKVAGDVAKAEDRDEKGRFKAKPIPDKKEDAQEKPKEAKGEEAKPAEAEKVEDKKKGRPDARQRVEQATRAAAEHRRVAEAAVRENQALRQALGVKKETAPQEQPKPTDKDAPPALADGQDPVEFVQKMSEWAAEKAQRQADQKREKEAGFTRYKQEASRREQKFAESMGEQVKLDPEFTERIDPRLLMLTPTFNLRDGDPPPNVWNALADEITDSPVAPQILLHLTEHEDELQRLVTLRPRELTRAMAKLEAKLEAATAGTPAPVVPPYTPSAAQPVTPVTGAATTAEGPPDVETCSPEEWCNYHNDRDRKQRRA